MVSKEEGGRNGNSSSEGVS
jgi:hypothetical protein